MGPGTLNIVTTSWDDGHPADLRVADLLSRYGIAGTFYVPRTNDEHAVMSPGQILSLSRGFEIGGHTLSHVRLTSVDKEGSWREILGCRTWLYDVLGEAPRSFCYPGGKWSSVVREQVADAGFQLARTTELLSTRLTDPFLAPTTLQVFRHRGPAYLRNAARNRSFTNITRLGRFLLSGRDLVRATEEFLDTLEAKGGIFHLWGHSWEIEECGLWGTLEELLRVLSSRRGFVYTTNIGVLHLLEGGNDQLPLPDAAFTARSA